LSPLRPASDEELDAQRELIADAHDWFRGLVEERRALTGEALDLVADGRAFTGRQALEVDLVDQIGGLREAESWLATRDSRLSDVPVRVVSLPEPELGWLDYLGNVSGLAEIYRDLRAREGIRLFSTLR
jgi:protease-4